MEYLSTIVGYREDNRKHILAYKNSWDTECGEDGYTIIECRINNPRCNYGIALEA